MTFVGQPGVGRHVHGRLVLLYERELPRDDGPVRAGSLTVDVGMPSFVEKHFTFNDMLLATWSFELKVHPYLVVAAAYLAEAAEHGPRGAAAERDARGHGLPYVWVRSAMPTRCRRAGQRVQ